MIIRNSALVALIVANYIFYPNCRIEPTQIGTKFYGLPINLIEIDRVF